jgi:carboxyl-terminal processing protease
MRHRPPFLPLAILFVFAAPVLAGEPPSVPAPPAAATPPDPVAAPPAAPGEALPATREASVDLDDIRSFTAVYSLIKQAYVEPVDDHRLMQAAIRGLLAGLDPHSEYLDAAQMDELAEDTSGSYAGLGIEVMQVEGTLRVISPIDDTPAARAGIKAGDTIVAIDARPVQSDDVDEAIDRLRGEPGTTVHLSVLHEGTGSPVEIVMQREVIRIRSVRGSLLEPGYAYLRISQFQVETGNELRKAIERLGADNHAPLKGAVLDLRSNPGGLLTAAVEVSDVMLDEGSIVSTRGRLGDSEMNFRSTPGDMLDGAPLVVLVDNGTASAAEIVAGALKDNHRGLLMGRRTFGKGSVQTVLPLDDEHAVKLTTARYYTPSGISIQAEGIRPDIALADLAVAPRDADATPMVSERDLRNHLAGAGDDSDPAAARGSDLAERDYALGEALNVLKGLALRNARPVAGEPPAKR